MWKLWHTFYIRLLEIFTNFLFTALPVKSEHVELLQVAGGPDDNKGWKMYRFRIFRHATWEYMMELKAKLSEEAKKPKDPQEESMETEQLIEVEKKKEELKPLLSFFRLDHGQERNGRVNVYATYELEAQRKVHVVYPYNRNPVL